MQYLKEEEINIKTLLKLKNSNIYSFIKFTLFLFYKVQEVAMSKREEERNVRIFLKFK